jgi:hypothetical protein
VFPASHARCTLRRRSIPPKVSTYPIADARWAFSAVQFGGTVPGEPSRMTASSRLRAGVVR